MIWRGHKDADDVYASKPFFAILTVFRCTALARSWSIKVGDIGTAFTNILFEPPSDLYTIKEHLLEAEKGDAWSQVIAKNLARPSSKHRARNKLHTIHIRTQRAPTSRMSTSYLLGEIAKKCYCERLVKNYHATHNFMLEKKNHQQRKSFRHQPWWWVRGQHLPPNDGQKMESCNNNRSNNWKNQHWRRTTAQSTGAWAVWSWHTPGQTSITEQNKFEERWRFSSSLHWIAYVPQKVLSLCSKK